MAKKQSFGDKVGHKDKVKNQTKLIRSGRSEKTGALRFNEEMIQIRDGESSDAVVNKLLTNKV